SDDERPEIARRLLADLDGCRASEDADAQHARDVEAEDDDERPADHADDVAIFEQRLDGRAERGAERHEHQREADDERHGVQQHAAARIGPEVAGEIADRHAGDERNIGGKQRQDTRRQEREQPRAERDGHAERGAHQRSIACTRPCAAVSSHARGPSATPVIVPVRSITKLDGSARTPYFSATVIFGSSATGKLNLCELTNGGTFLGSPSSEMATSTNPASLWRRHSRSIAGISSRHGGHHVAQKFTSTTLPRCAESVKSPPACDGSVKSSASRARVGLIRSSCLRATSMLGPAAGDGLAGAVEPAAAAGSDSLRGPTADGAAASGVGAIAAA